MAENVHIWEVFVLTDFVNALCKFIVLSLVRSPSKMYSLTVQKHALGYREYSISFMSKISPLPATEPLPPVFPVDWLTNTIAKIFSFFSVFFKYIFDWKHVLWFVCLGETPISNPNRRRSVGSILSGRRERYNIPKRDLTTSSNRGGCTSTRKRKKVPAEEPPCDPRQNLRYSGKLFGGLRNDFKLRSIPS